MSFAHMPTSNSGKAGLPLGNRHGAAKIVKSQATSGSAPAKGGSKPHMPTKNAPTTKVKLGSTKHTVGCTGTTCNC